ncbi:MAG TPA: glycosyltransferase [Acidimicrobiales bacterium]
MDHTAQLSGGQLAMARLIGGLHEQVDVQVVLGEDGPLVHALQVAGADVVVMPIDRSAATLARRDVALRSLPLVPAAKAAAHGWELARHLRRTRPDVVHLNTLKALFYGGVAARLAGRPAVWHARDRITPDYLPAGAVAVTRLAARTLPSFVIANSVATLSTLPLRRPHAVVPSPVDAAAFVTAAPPPGPLAVGMVGRIAPWKGQDVLLRAFALAFPGGDASVRLIGAPLFGEEAYERRLHDLADELGIAGRVAFGGFSDDVPGELGRLHVLVHASVLPEPFGQVVVEGMAAGLPVVATRAGGPAEIVTEGRDGLLVAPGDAAELAGALRRLALDADLRSRLGAAARETAGRFRVEAVAGQVMGIYAALAR